LQKETEIRAEKGQTKNVKLRWHRDRKRGSYRCTFHPRWCTGSMWPYKTTFFFLSCTWQEEEVDSSWTLSSVPLYLILNCHCLTLRIVTKSCTHALPGFLTAKSRSESCVGVDFALTPLNSNHSCGLFTLGSLRLNRAIVAPYNRTELPSSKYFKHLQFLQFARGFVDITMCGVGACGFRDVWSKNVPEGWFFVLGVEAKYCVFNFFF